MTNKHKLIAGSLAGIGVASIVGLSSVSAASSTTGDSLASKIASAFHLKTADVQKVIDADRADHQTEMKQKLTDRLTTAVTDGKITAAQKTAILAKVQAIDDARDAAKDSTDTTKREAVKTAMDALQQYLKDNNISRDIVGPIGHGGPGGRGDFGGMPPGSSSSSASPSPSPSPSASPSA